MTATATRTMRALAKTRPAPGAELVERPVPSPGPGEVLLKMEAASICGTDRTSTTGSCATTPESPGHDVASAPTKRVATQTARPASTSWSSQRRQPPDERARRGGTTSSERTMKMGEATLNGRRILVVGASGRNRSRRRSSGSTGRCVRRVRSPHRSARGCDRRGRRWPRCHRQRARPRRLRTLGSRSGSRRSVASTSWCTPPPSHPCAGSVTPTATYGCRSSNQPRRRPRVVRPAPLPF